MARFDPRRFVPRRSHKTGLAPGSVVPVEAPEAGPVRLSVMEYGPEGVRERADVPPEECRDLTDPADVAWLNVDGLHDATTVEEVGRIFGLHPLSLEDAVNTGQRPKLEDYDDYLFLVVKMLTWSRDRGEVEEEQVSLAVGSGWVVSFQERPGDVFDPVRERIRSGRGRIRTLGADYLAYALVDAVVDHYFVVLERLVDRVAAAEARLVEDPDEETLREIHALKRELIHLRRSVWPAREVTAKLTREDTSMVTDRVRVFTRDVHDHSVQVIETTEALRDAVGGMLDTYLSTASNRMNEVMQVLTVMATIFIPLTFIAGVYGMNFENMPELQWPWAYPAVMGIMGGAAVIMLVYFRRRGWL